MAVKPTLLRDFCSLLQRLECNNEVIWILCNLSFADLQISVLIDWILIDQILLCISFRTSNPSSGFAHSPLIQVYAFASLFHFFHTLIYIYSQFEHLYIYLSDYQVGSSIKLQINKSLYWPTLHGKLCSKIIPALTDWARLIQRIPWNPSIAGWTR